MRKALLLTLAIGLCLGAKPPPAHAADPEVVWVSPSGSDTNDGLTRTTPLRTLQAANGHLCALIPFPNPCDAGLGRKVEVRLLPGTYTGASVTWTYSDPTYETYFVPADWVPGWTYSAMIAAGGYPVLDGSHGTDWGFYSEDSRHLRFHYLKWYRYVMGGIYQSGGSDTYVYGNVFDHFGTYYRTSTDWAYSGITLDKVSGSTIQNDTFSNILNDTDGYGHEHGAYLVGADNNQILNNLFTNVGGDPVRVRDGSDSNIVTGNTFTSTGSHGYIGDWYCITAINTCTYGQESKSFSNVFKTNTLNGHHVWAQTPWADRYCYDTLSLCPSNRISP